MATVLIDSETLLKTSKITNEDERFYYALRGRHGLGNQGEVFFGNPSVFEGNHESVTIKFDPLTLLEIPFLYLKPLSRHSIRPCLYSYIEIKSTLDLSNNKIYQEI